MASTADVVASASTSLPESYKHYSYSFKLPFEHDFNLREKFDWFDDNLFIPMILGIGYVSMVVRGPSFLKSVPTYNLKGVLKIWNAMAACFHTLGFLRVLPDFLYHISVYGFFQSLCKSDDFFGSRNSVSAVWLWNMMIFKHLQLAETAFLLLQKKKVPFVHVFHRFGDLYALSYGVVVELPSQTRFVVTSTYLEHAIMYIFLATRSKNPRTARSLAGLPVLLDTAYHLFGLYTSVYIYTRATNDPASCSCSPHTAALCAARYASSCVILLYYYYYKHMKQSEKKED